VKSIPFVLIGILIIGSIGILSFDNAFAQDENLKSIISASTDRTSYQKGDSVIFSGKVTNYEFGKTVSYVMDDPDGYLLSMGQIVPKSDGSFSYTFESDWALWRFDGNYVIKYHYADDLSDKSQTTYYYSISGTSSDTTPPQVIVPSDIILDESTGDYITLEYDVKAIDDVDGVITPTCDFESGFVFRTSEPRDTIPRILVECTATDSAGNTGSNHFMVTFVSIPDTTPPVVITFDANMTIDAGTDEYVKLEYFVKAIDEVDGLMTPTCDIRSGSVIPVGQWLVTCTATDRAGNTGSISFMVTITSSSDTSSLDTTPPHVMVPSDMIIYPGTGDYITLEYDVKAIDDVDGVITPTCDVGSGSVISVVSVKRLLVTCTATDSAGNTGSTSFTVTITSTPDTTPPVVITSGVGVVPELEVIVTKNLSVPVFPALSVAVQVN